MSDHDEAIERADDEFEQLKESVEERADRTEEAEEQPQGGQANRPDATSAD
jgi:hypothetical protein